MTGPSMRQLHWDSVPLGPGPMSRIYQVFRARRICKGGGGRRILGFRVGVP